MHFGFALNSSDMDFWDLDLLGRNIPNKYFACMQDALKTSWRHVVKTSSRHVLKKSSRRFQDQQIFAGLFPVSGPLSLLERKHFHKQAAAFWSMHYVAKYK